MDEKENNQVFQWPRQSPDLNPTEMLWQDLQRAVHKQMPANLDKLKQCCYSLHNGLQNI